MQMKKAHLSGGTALSADELWLEYVRFIKQCLRDLQPLNRQAVDVCQLIESSISGNETNCHDLIPAQRQLLVDIIHHLVSLVREITPAARKKLAARIEKQLNKLVVKYGSSVTA